jgi:capsular polysaccharide biosynthesis protein
MQQEKLLNSFSVTRNPPLNYSTEDSDVFNDSTLDASHPPVYLFNVNNAYVSPFGVVFKNGVVEKESVYFYHHHWKNALTFYKKILLRKIVKTDKTCSVIHNGWYDNYYHWCMEALPRLFSMKDKVSQLNLILPSNLKKFHEQTLSFFNINSIIPCKEDELVFAPSVWFTSFTTKGFGQHNPGLIREMSSFFKSKISPTGKFNHLKNIYTARTKAPKRKCLNEDELIELLKKYDFEIIVPDNLTVPEQIELFGQVKNVVGVHGSSFVNSLYMKPESRIFDLIEQNHNDLCFFNMADAFDVRYVYVRCKGQGRDADFRDNDIYVDIKKLDGLLDKYMLR